MKFYFEIIFLKSANYPGIYKSLREKVFMESFVTGKMYTEGSEG